MDGGRKKTYPEYGDPDPKGQILYVFFYMQMLSLNYRITIEVKCLARDQLGGGDLLRKGEQTVLLWRDNLETRTEGLRQEGDGRER